jgi:hypothetical protein
MKNTFIYFPENLSLLPYCMQMQPVCFLLSSSLFNFLKSTNYEY